MSLGGQLKQGLNGLRKTTINHDASAPKLGDQFAETEASFRTYQSTVMDINLEEWIDLIPEHTFPSKMMEISPDDADIFVKSYLEFEAHMDRATVQGERRGMRQAACSFVPSAEVQERTRGLEGRLQKVIDEVKDGDPTASVFIKTSCRSPKDAPTSQGKLRDVYSAMVSADPDQSENARIAHLLRAGLEVMRVREANDALGLLTKSRRIWQDMTLALEHKDRWNQHIIVRKWQDIDVDMEFRCFVSGGQMTAISQYNHLCFFPHLVEKQESIKQLLLRFFNEELRDKLSHKFENYVVDLAIVKCDSQQQRVMVIELNPFLETTDSACFNWVSNRALLEGKGGQRGEHTCEMRVTEHCMLGAKSLMEETWRSLME
eukprot:CAMPEP_0181324830 /NCGR_PEP_ID=MMETSP1101-20121128/20581_1 /TAXON_ID=46948 /ORGANISM="Rhodomonas abbreviata, Strain Caron Lab Isolate" /LENGTH=374 /DNA_ID=CAMNT_0023433057 /DNA_START=77 /DNA_END=1198 /DNA_ORIENTATION=+